MRNFKTVICTAGLAIAAAGCASAPKEKVIDDAEAAKRSQAYLESVELFPASGKAGTSAKCVIPPSADKPAPGKGQGPSKEWKTLVAHAGACAQEKDWKKLETLANSIARIDIDSPWGAYFLSLSAEGTGDFQRAMWMVDLAQKKAGGRSGLFAYQKGRIFYRLGSIPAAMKEIERALAVDAKLVEGHLFLAEIYHRDLDPDRAMSHYEAVLVGDSRSLKALTGLGELKLQKGSVAEATDLYNRAISAHPGHLKAWLRLAYIYESVQKNNQLALSTYKNLKNSIEAGSMRERPDFDLGAKIRALEEMLKQQRVPAQASAKEKREG